MSKPTLASLDKRVVKVETQLEERWKENPQEMSSGTLKWKYNIILNEH